ncbi:MAG: type ISP restriction/modification enzyme, partial [Stellaceae bacterium]
MTAAYGRPVAAMDVFDGMLALLSASSYATRFAFDIEDEFPHVPFPADPDAFVEAASLGSRIRELEGLVASPAAGFRSARLLGRASAIALDVPSPQRAFAGEGSIGTVALLPDRSLVIAGVPERVWRFEVSGYAVFYRWLRARNGEPVSGPSGAALLREALDLAWRIAELLDLFDRADAVLARA